MAENWREHRAACAELHAEADHLPVDARSRGQRVVVRHGGAEVSLAEAAALLGVSRPQVRKFMDEGKLGFRRVGAHHRIPLESIEAFRAWEWQQVTAGVEELSRLQNELGLLE
ncbi:helix-turn-helix domain-containing protein [Microbacterium sp. SCN 69-37]|uniref:helix-turn-helix domain-containing protein n=1 Tax=Microbacterium sp. SCN 69-37 TaxID=1660115 RepID=UPI000ADD4E29|nr:helix-turn-helix domain-containing protein [Microbacterium sp. SCN 69-37]